MKKIDFEVDYKKLNIFEEYNTDSLEYPIVLSSPHSGTIFPEEFLNVVNVSKDDLRSSEDAFVDELVKQASDSGIPMIAMNIARTFIDVNRDKIEIDEQMFYDYETEQTDGGTRRSRVGLGVIHRIVQQNKKIYDGLLSYQEAQSRIANVYEPYHNRLNQLVDKCCKKFGFCLLVDCHSMPSVICNIMNDEKPVEFCVSTLFDQSCPQAYYSHIFEELSKNDYRVEYDRPYCGGYITFNYCQPRKNLYTLQIETNRSLYMNEESMSKNEHFQEVATALSSSIQSLGKFLLDFKK